MAARDVDNYTRLIWGWRTTLHKLEFGIEDKIEYWIVDLDHSTWKYKAYDQKFGSAELSLNDSIASLQFRQTISY